MKASLSHTLKITRPFGRRAERMQPAAGMTGRPIRVLHVFGRMGRGGAELRTLDIFRRLDASRFRFDFCAISGMTGELDEEIRSRGGQVYPLRLGHYHFVDRFERLLREQEYDVVHSHLQSRSGYLMYLAARCGVPTRVVHFRSSQEQRSGTPLRRMARRLLSPFVKRYAPPRVLRRWIDCHATHIVGVSRAALELAWNPCWKADPRCQVVYDGLETLPPMVANDSAGVRREFGFADNALLVIHVGRMVEAKNHLRLVSIFAKLHKQRPDARLLLVSRRAATTDEVSIEQRLRREIDRLDLAPFVRFSGERTDVLRLMHAADLLVFPSRWEGLGDVVLEARAVGTPVLSSELPSVREIASHLGGVRCLSLNEPDTRWTQAASQMTHTGITPEQRRVARGIFADSVFTVERCARSLREIWSCAVDVPSSAGGHVHG